MIFTMVHTYKWLNNCIKELHGGGGGGGGDIL